MSTYLSGAGPAAIAHRGGSLEVAENSRAAVEHTVSLGLQYFETDVRATRDGVAVLAHDPTVDRTTDGTGPVAALTWQELARLRDASGERPVRLDELLADYPRLRLNIDAKDDAVLAPLIHAVTEAGAHERVCLASFDDHRLARLRAAFDGAVCTSLGRRETARLLATVYRPRRRRPPARAAWAADGAACVQVPPRHRGIPVVTRAFVALAHEHGLAVHVWTVDEPADMHRLLDLGVDGLISDRPRVLREVLQSRGHAWH